MRNIHLARTSNRNYSIRASGGFRALKKLRDTGHVEAIAQALDLARERKCTLYVHDSTGRICSRIVPSQLKAPMYVGNEDGVITV